MQELIQLVETVMAEAGVDARRSVEAKRSHANILGVAIDAVNMEGAVSEIQQRLRSDSKGYVCAVGVHGILEALRSPAVADAFAESALNVPDGTPTVWLGRLQGFRHMDHVTGPALMQEVFRRREFAACSHFFYGGKIGVAEELASTMRQQFPWVQIAGTYTPPFRDLNAEEERRLIADIDRRRPDIIWVGISTPRQEIWMRRMLPRLQTRMMFGVGAAFDFHTGRVRKCPAWVKRAGFHWLHRLLQDPRRLWRRNVFNTAFLWHIALQLSHIRKYPLNRRDGVNRESLAADRTAVQTYSNDLQAAAAHSLHQD